LEATNELTTGQEDIESCLRKLQIYKANCLIRRGELEAIVVIAAFDGYSPKHAVLCIELYICKTHQVWRRKDLY